MGKKDKLIQARKESQDDVSCNVYLDDDYMNNENVENESVENEYFEETISMINFSLKKFIDFEALSIGEFLDTEYIAYFVENILQ